MMLAAYIGWDNHDLVNGLLRASFQASLLVVLVLLVQWLLGRHLSARWRYNLWFLVILRLIMPFTLESRFSVFNWIQPGPTTVVSQTGLMLKESELPENVSPPESYPQKETMTPPLSLAGAKALSRSAGEGEINQLPRTTNPSLPRGRLEIKSASFPWTRWFLGVWLAGVSLLLIRVSAKTVDLFRRVHPLKPVQDVKAKAILDQCRQLMRVRTPVQLVETRHVTGPGLCRLGGVRLLVPPGLLTQLSSHELEHVFLHELAHLKRRDLGWNWVVVILQIMHWFNPMLWLAASRMRADRELACDAMVMEHVCEVGTTAYGQTIIKLLEGINPPSAAPGLVGILEDPAQMKRRILMIAQFKPQKSRSFWAGLLVVALGLISLTDARSARPSPESSLKQPPQVNSTAKAGKGRATKGNQGNSRLRKNATMRGRVVDPEGNPIPEATVAVCHPLAMAIQFDTDPQGRFMVTNTSMAGFIEIFKTGFISIRVRHLPLTDQELIITMHHTLVLEGEVVDGQTGNRIAEFRVTPARQPSRQTDSPNSAANVSVDRLHQRTFSDGSFGITINDPYFVFGPGEKDFCLLIEATGYFPIVSRDIRFDEVKARLKIQMQMQSNQVAWSGLVKLPDGAPATNVTLWVIGSPGSSINQGKLVRQNSTIGIKTDAQGRCTIPAQFPRYTIVLAEEAGIATVFHTQLAGLSEIQMQAWGKLEGTFFHGRVPATNSEVMLMFDHTSMAMTDVRLEARTTPDIAGRFVFDRVPPADLLVYNLIEGNGPPLTNVTVLPGQTTRLTLGGIGRPVVGRFLFPPAFAQSNSWSLDRGVIHRRWVDVQEPPGLKSEPERLQWRQAWSKTEEGRNYKFRANQAVPIRVNPDGTFRADGLRAGQAWFDVKVESRLAAANEPDYYIPMPHQEFVIPQFAGSISDEPFNVGDVKLYPLHTLRELEPYPNLEATNLKGGKLRLADFHGKCVVLTYNSARSLKEPSLKEMRSRLEPFIKKDQVTLVTLVTDSNHRAIRQLIKEQDIDWTVGWLGTDGEKVLLEKYQIQPTYPPVLLGPNREILKLRDWPVMFWDDEEIPTLLKQLLGS